MKELAFDNMLSVGIDEIDGDHRKLIDLFNMLKQAVEEGGKADYVAAVLDELIKCTIWHFSHEERLMIRYGYSAYEDHHQEHEELIASAKAFQQDYLDSGKLDEKDFAFLERWLTEHILVADNRLANFLLEVM